MKAFLAELVWNVGITFLFTSRQIMALFCCNSFMSAPHCSIAFWKPLWKLSLFTNTQIIWSQNAKMSMFWLLKIHCSKWTLIQIKLCKALNKLLSCYLYIVPHCLQNPPLLQPENNHRPVNFPLLQHFPETRNVSQQQQAWERQHKPAFLTHI